VEQRSNSSIGSGDISGQVGLITELERVAVSNGQSFTSIEPRGRIGTLPWSMARPSASSFVWEQ